MKASLALALLLLLGTSVATMADELAGKLGGTDWKGTFSKITDKGEKLLANVYAKPVKGMKEEFTTPHLIISLPKKSGTYDISKGVGGVTFFTPPGNNSAVTSGKMVVTVSTEGTTITLDVKFDDNNWAKGTLAIKPSETALPKGQ